MGIGRIFLTKDIQSLHPLSFDPVSMDDAQCAETNFRVFIKNYINEYKTDQKSDHNSKNKNLQFYFSFASAHYATFMKVGSKLHILSWDRAEVPTYDLVQLIS